MARLKLQLAKWRSLLTKNQLLLQEARDAVEEIKLVGNAKSWGHHRQPQFVLEDCLKEIARFQREIEKLKNAEQPPQDPEVNARFRRYVVQRQAIVPAFDALIQAQTNYLAAMEQFKVIARDNRFALEFSDRDLPDVAQVKLNERGQVV